MNAGDAMSEYFREIEVVAANRYRHDPSVGQVSRITELLWLDVVRTLEADSGRPEFQRFSVVAPLQARNCSDIDGRLVSEASHL